eukprot:COSAG05_NODE_508_length_9135_cov_30.269780_6_plen_74_part_00
MDRDAQAPFLFILNGALSTISENVFVATVRRLSSPPLRCVCFSQRARVFKYGTLAVLSALLRSLRSVSIESVI